MQLHVRDAGTGSPILLLHPFPLNGESLVPLMNELAPQHRVLVPDLRGFGKSELGGSPERPITMDTYAEDALALLDQRGIEDAVIGGVSMGGYVAMALARKAPRRVRGLILMDTQASPDDKDGKIGREETARAVLERGPRVLVDKLLQKLLSSRAMPELREHVESMILDGSPEAAAAALRAMALRPDSFDVLSHFERPALIVVGEDDAITPPEKARAMEAVLARGKVVIVPSSGHLSPLESPAFVARAIQALFGARA